MAGQQYATGAAIARGYWQINPGPRRAVHLRPAGNAKAAVIISDGGTN